ncbi:MAG: hypoxanthine phosphoribosyltransferase [Thermoflexibacteraceae bacterium]|jgi:hypoxanthine phosphoribosyltransferase
MQVQIHDKVFRSFITEQQIQDRIVALGQQLAQDYSEKNPLFVAILNGAFMFAADLFRSCDFPSEISFIKYKSYQNTKSSGEVNKLIGFSQTVKGRDVIIVEDIIDSGLTMAEVLQDIQQLQPNSVEVVTLLFKPDAFQGDFETKYIGFEIPNQFVVGYGLDYNEQGRNLRDICVLVP